jgi:excisionase family DNA binding protein
LRVPDGPPLSVGQLVAFSGLSDETIRREIEAKQLTAYRTRGGHWRIYWRSAHRWAITLGILRISPQTSQTSQTSAIS